jgi:hypothetical protein
MWSVSALAMCCAASEIKHCVIVMVQLYCCVFTFIVFVGDGWLALVPAHLPHLRVLRLVWSDSVRNEHLEDLVAAAPQLLVIIPSGNILSAPSNSLVSSYVECCCESAPVIIRQLALDR